MVNPNTNKQHRIDAGSESGFSNPHEVEQGSDATGSVEALANAHGASMRELAGTEMQNVPGFAEALATTQERSHDAPRVAPRDRSLPSVVSNEQYRVDVPVHSPRHTSDDFSPQRLTRGALLSAGVNGAVGEAAAFVPFYFLAGKGVAGSLLAAAPVAAQAGIAGATTYGMGVVHNLLWKKPGKAVPGTFGTLLRGIIAPVTIPVGLLRNLTWNRKG